MHRILVLVLSLALMLPATVMARQMGDYSVEISPQCRAKIKQLSRNGSNCCATADGWEAKEVVWDIENNHYVVVIEGTRYPVPDEAVLTESNCAGIAIVWYVWDQEEQRDKKTIRFRCFWPGPGASLRAPQGARSLFFGYII